LLSSGDTEKIIFFAGTARQAEIYVLAGNYLQSLDWRSNNEIMKNIIQFYSKAKAYDKLAAFYDACAQVEIDEYRDYEKAGGAMQEAMRYMKKSIGDGAEHDPRVQSLHQRIGLVEKFAGVRKLFSTDPQEMVRVCEQLLATPDVEVAVRPGDIYAQLTEHYVRSRQFEEAHRVVELMRSRGIVLSPYVDRASLESIYSAMGLQVPGDSGVGHGGAMAGVAEGIEEEMEEEIHDEG